MIVRPGTERTAPTDYTHVEERAKQSIKIVAAEKHLDQYKISRMIREAGNPDNYGHYVYKHTIGAFVFEFRLHRTSVVLVGVTQRF